MDHYEVVGVSDGLNLRYRIYR